MNSIVLKDNIGVFMLSETGFSKENNRLKDILKKAINEFKKAETIGRFQDEALHSLNEIYDDCSVSDWDGYNSLAVSKETYLEARKLITSLPLKAFSTPEIVPEPNGEIALEWYISKKQVFVVSVSGENELTYAGLFGSNKVNGTEYYKDIIPNEIINNLKRLYS